jgi:hypothetical protein
MRPEAEMDGRTIESVIDELIRTVPVLQDRRR